MMHERGGVRAMSRLRHCEATARGLHKKEVETAIPAPDQQVSRFPLLRGLRMARDGATAMRHKGEWMQGSGTDDLKEQGTRDRILKAAAELFAEHGYSAASISKIAKRAEVLPGSLYWAFGSKEKLFAAVIDQTFEAWLSQFILYFEDRGTEADDLNGLFLRTARGIRRQPEFLRLLMVVATERQAGDTEILDAAKRIRRLAFQLISDKILPALTDYDPDQAKALAARIGRLSLQLLDGIFMSLRLDSGEVDAEALFREAADVVARELEAGASDLRRRSQAGQS